jgi:hypothetical protein
MDFGVLGRRDECSVGALMQRAITLSHAERQRGRGRLKWKLIE